LKGCKEALKEPLTTRETYAQFGPKNEPAARDGRAR
jgi:hypothetical protein